MKYIVLFFLIAFAFQNCDLPDYKVGNPKPLLDAPAFNVVPNGTDQKTANGKKGFDGKTIGVTYVKYGATVDFSIAVTDCPGKIASIESSISVPSYAEAISVDKSSLSTIIGQETGSSKVNLTVFSGISNAERATDRAANLIFTVSDSQKDESGNPTSTSVTWPIVLVSCVGNGLPTGTFKVISSAGNLDGGIPFTLQDILADSNSDSILVKIESTRPGLYTFDEVTGGVWPVYYSGRANPKLSLDLCENNLSGHPGLVVTGSGTSVERVFSITGSVNLDKTVSISWSYQRTSGTPANPAKGTYTLAKLP